MRKMIFDMLRYVRGINILLFASPFQIIRHFDFSRYITFTMYLENDLQFGTEGALFTHAKIIPNRAQHKESFLSTKKNIIMPKSFR